MPNHVHGIVIIMPTSVGADDDAIEPVPVGAYGHTPLRASGDGMRGSGCGTHSPDAIGAVSVGAYGHTPLRPFGDAMRVPDDVMRVPEDGVRGSGDVVVDRGSAGGVVVGAYGDTPLHLPDRALRSPAKTLGAMVRAFKGAVTARINTLRATPGTPVWQRNYHEHIIRDERSLNRIRQYIRDNPAQWAFDPENPACRPDDDPGATRRAPMKGKKRWQVGE